MKRKKPYITIGTPHRRDFSPEYVQSMVHTLKSKKFNFEFIAWEGTQIHLSRSAIAQFSEGEYLLFIDTDMAWTSQDIERLVAADKDIVGGLYVSRQSGLPVLLRIDDKGEVIPDSDIPDIPEEPFLCKFVGTGFFTYYRLLRMKVNKRQQNLSSSFI